MYNTTTSLVYSSIEKKMTLQITLLLDDKVHSEWIIPCLTYDGEVYVGAPTVTKRSLSRKLGEIFYEVSDDTFDEANKVYKEILEAISVLGIEIVE